MELTDWFLSAAERGNTSTRLDSRHLDGRAWTSGNEIVPLVHGVNYFAELLRCLREVGEGDLVMFTDWRGDPDEHLDESGVQVSQALCEAAERGAVVKGLIWRSHLDKFAYSQEQNRYLGEDIEKAGGECLLDQRVRPGGSHHQKFVAIRHTGRSELDVAFVGGIDLCHSRRDDAAHAGDPQSLPMADVYGETPPWHDVQVMVHGPAVADVETSFRERWEDPAPLNRNPADMLSDVVHHTDRTPGSLPAQLPDPAPRGSAHIQLIRTYGNRHPGYPFAPEGERSVARAYSKVVPRAERLIYLEDQYLWSAEVVAAFADALRRTPSLRLIAVIPHHPDLDGTLSFPASLVGRQAALDLLYAAAPDRVAIYGVENPAGDPVYVHAKACVIDDVWASVGSDNINLRSWTHDSELACAVLDDERDLREPQFIDRFGHGARKFARELRLELAREHLDLDDDSGVVGPEEAFEAFAESAAQLQAWHDCGCVGDRPPGRLRPYRLPRLSRRTLAWATPLYSMIYDPDGRPLRMRFARRF